MESEVRGIYRNLTDAINDYNRARTPSDSLRASRLVKQYTLELGIHRELRIDSTARWTPDDIARIEDFAEELANEKITGALYVMGRPLLRAAYRIYSRSHGCGSDSLQPPQTARRRSERVASQSAGTRQVRSVTDDAAICRLTGLTTEDLDSARNILRSMEGSRDMLSRMMVMGAMMP